MPTVRDQDKDHPLYSRLAAFFDSRVRLWSPGKKRKTHSPKLKICQAILAFAVKLTFGSLHIFAALDTDPGRVFHMII